MPSRPPISAGTHWETQKRYDWADEFVDVVKGLWDTFEDDAFVRDPETGRFIDPSKVHQLNHRGRYFSVDGPLNVTRPVQGHPVILHAGTSERSRELGARDADVIFAGQPTIAAAQAYYADIKSRAKKYGRSDHEISILPGLTPIVAETTEEAVAIYDHLNTLLVLDPDETADGEVRLGGLGREKHRNLTRVSAILGVDVRGSDRDQTVASEVFERARDEGKRLFAEITRRMRRTVGGSNPIIYRDLIYTASAGGAIVGNADEVADYIQEWYEVKAADGFNVFPAYDARSEKGLCRGTHSRSNQRFGGDQPE